MKSVEQMREVCSMSGPTEDRADELRDLRALLDHAQERAAAALRAGLPGDRPGDALRRFLAADAEVTAIARKMRRLAASRDQPLDG
jgi:hypothetical protein